MKIFLRALILLLVVIWLGGELFFPVVAANAFGSLADTHAAGTVVGKCLNFLHYEGLIAGTLIIVLLLAAHRLQAYLHHVAAPIVLTVVMLGLTAYSQFSIIPRMETFRIAAGGSIEGVPEGNPARVGFNQLHNTSVHVEEGVMVAGLALAVLLARG
ncbi:DUF4149 domain-containing protein [Acidipila rosea]|uniref:Uncharacterized protein DUF4149 n=1 Tax=Acidipila rosea TaxID=768535 RepID=A0A4R1L6S3_9BACT|nr:DUF4149 domain-containing protein [Acidipila rosea]MBW4043576.1 DUF4149 domain-containing protein [Acidobacteriota bacterium]TCK73875.1 uncharacterized protein DUF4149 [Acidipila rosea]